MLKLITLLHEAAAAGRAERPPPGGKQLSQEEPQKDKWRRCRRRQERYSAAWSLSAPAIRLRLLARSLAGDSSPASGKVLVFRAAGINRWELHEEAK